MSDDVNENVEEIVADEVVAEEVVAEQVVEAPAPSTPRPPVVIDRPIQTVGRRKEAVVRVRLVPGTGQFHLDGRTLEDLGLGDRRGERR